MIRFDNVSYKAGESFLIQDLSFQVEDGETIVLLGRSGSGKTTTLKLINHLLTPTSGAVLVKEKSTLDWDPILLRRGIGYVIQDVGLFPHLTVHENVSLVPRLQEWTSDKISIRVNEVLKLVDLNPEIFSSRYPRQLSGGQRQRVGVARALCADPPILLLDEPFGALDPISRAEIQNQFQQLRRTLGKTMVFVTHDVSEALMFGDRIGLMEGGTMLALGSANEFLRSKDEAIQSFLAPVRNLQSIIT